jgi:hypothetical protein
VKKLLLLVILLPAAAYGIGIADFESGGPNWETKANGGAALNVTTDADHVKEGEAAGELAVDYASSASGAISFALPEDVEVTTEGGITFWLFGDGSGSGLQFAVVAEDGGIFSKEQSIDWTGWEKVEIPVNSLAFNRFGGAPDEAARTLDPAAIRTFLISTYPSLKADEEAKTFYLDSIELNP